MVFDSQEYERWIKQALYTLSLIDSDISCGGYSWACFKAQQAAEYALKALLRGVGRPAFGHSVKKFVEELVEFCGIVPEDVFECAIMLDKMYIPTRYPDAFPEGSPYEYYTRNDAEKAKRCAEKIIEWVKNCVERIKNS